MMTDATIIMDRDNKSKDLAQQLAESVKQAGVVVGLYETNTDDNSVSIQRKNEVSSTERKYVLSIEKTDREGNFFYERDGEIDLWDITPLTTMAKRQNAPVRITAGSLQHILDRHGKELGDKESVFRFLDSVFDKASQLRLARGTAMFVVVNQDNTDKVAIVQLAPSEYGDFYNVESAGYYRKGKWKDVEKIIAELSEPTQSATASDNSKPQVSLFDGRKSFNAESQSSSECKDNNNFRNMQEKSNKTDVKPLILDETGELKAFSYKGAIYINKKYLTPEVTLHEYTHLWAEVLRQCNPEEWQNVVAMMKETPEIWNYVQKTYPDLDTEDDIAEEVLAQYSGKRGQEKLFAFVEGKDTSDNIIQKISEALSYFWDAVCDFLHIHYTDKEQVADRVLYDLLTGVNPLNYTRQSQQKELADAKARLIKVLDSARTDLGDTILIKPTPVKLTGNFFAKATGVFLAPDGAGGGEFRLAGEYYAVLAVENGGHTEFDVTKILDNVSSINSLAKAVRDVHINNLEQKSKQAIRDRIVSPSARSFTSDQVEVLNRYHQVVAPDTPAGEVYSHLLQEVAQESDVARKPEKWVADTAKELNNLAEGITREQSRGLHK